MKAHPPPDESEASELISEERIGVWNVEYGSANARILINFNLLSVFCCFGGNGKVGVTFGDSRLVLLVMFTYWAGSANTWEMIVHTIY